MMKIKYSMALLSIVISVSGCAFFDYGVSFNKQTRATQTQTNSQTSFVLRQQREAKNCTDGVIRDPKQNKNVLVMLALSGGGSRAAYFSALSMLEMENIELKIGDSKSNLLHEVDVISSVSGGSLAGAYYAISHDPGSECAGHAHRLWNDAKVRELMTLDYRSRWIGRWFYPNNIARFWFTKFDRTDIMAQTLADKVFDKPITGSDLSLGELNPLRPNLILNATTGIDDRLSGIGFGEVFTFTKEDFARICSSIEDYSVARAVMATATFPGAFNYMTLRNYCRKDSAGDTSRRYLHIFDGGNADNLGLTSLKRVIWTSLKDRDTQPSLPYKNVIIIVVDAFINYHGVDSNKSDPRGYFDFILDLNFLDATDSLLEANRKQLLTEFDQEYPYLFPFAMGSNGKINKKCKDFFHSNDDVEKYCRKPSVYWQTLNKIIGEKLTFVHLSFDNVGDVAGCLPNQSPPDSECLRHQLNRIPTDFRLRYLYRHKGTGLTDIEAIDCAVPTLFGRQNQSCGQLSPKPSQDLPLKWERVKQILQETTS